MEEYSIRDAFGNALVEAGERFQDIVVVSCDLKGATRTKAFFEKFPERSIEVGIAEANGLGICAGLALSNFRPFISSFGTFITGKNIEIRTSIAYNQAPVVIVGTHGGLIGADGTTQASLQDIAMMRAIPNFEIFQPASPIETRAIVHYLAESRAPAYLRISRNKVPEIYNHDYAFRPGKGYVLNMGTHQESPSATDITIISSGPMVHAALKAAQLLKDSIEVLVINMPSLKPIDRSLIVEAAELSGAVLTVEDHSVEGGLGSMVSDVIAEKGLATPVVRHGIYDVFTESGSPFRSQLTTTIS